MNESAGKAYIIVRLRGSAAGSISDEHTLGKLRLKKVNNCTVMPATGSTEGMLKKVSKYLTWGEADTKTLESMLAKRGRTSDGKRIQENDSKKLAEKLAKGEKTDAIKPVFRLTPPSKGLRSAMLYYPRGDLGYRGEKISDLVARMI